MFQPGDLVVPCEEGLGEDMYLTWQRYMEEHDMSYVRVVRMNGDHVVLEMPYDESDYLSKNFKLLNQSPMRALSMKVMHTLMAG